MEKREWREEEEGRAGQGSREKHGELPGRVCEMTGFRERARGTRGDATRTEGPRRRGVDPSASAGVLVGMMIQRLRSVDCCSRRRTTCNLKGTTE